VFADAIRKIFLFRLTTHIGERKDANRHARLCFHLAVFDLSLTRRAQDNDVYPALDALHRVLAEVLERARHLASHMVADGGRQAVPPTGALACSRAATSTPSP